MIWQLAAGLGAFAVITLLYLLAWKGHQEQAAEHGDEVARREKTAPTDLGRSA